MYIVLVVSSICYNVHERYFVPDLITFLLISCTVFRFLCRAYSLLFPKINNRNSSIFWGRTKLKTAEYSGYREKLIIGPKCRTQGRLEGEGRGGGGRGEIRRGGGKGLRRQNCCFSLIFIYIRRLAKAQK